ncbi:MAG: peptidyl-alpha-hydroxyglycine alpha-amidating lyase family protein, partial [Woeseiaceae bacterium]
MAKADRFKLVFIAIFTVSTVMAAAESLAQHNNPYRAYYSWAKLPEGRVQGVVAGIYADPDGQHIWLMDRCGGNNCAGVDVDPILKFDLQGNFVRSFGKGLFGWPHGFFVDHEGNLWVTEGSPAGEPRGEAGFRIGRGHQVFKLSPDGEVLMTLGEAAVPGDDETHFNGPAHAVVARNGDIWVADGHRGGNNRLVKFTADGKFIMQIGGGIESATVEHGLFNDPHHIAMDSTGRLFVSDRGNNRVQIFDQEGTFLGLWTHFGRPSSIAIDSDDRIYVVDGTTSLTGVLRQQVYSGQVASGGGSYGYNRGIWVGDATNGSVEAFIPELEISGFENGVPLGVDQEF